MEKDYESMRKRNLKEINIMDIPEPKYLIRGLLREGGAAMVFGPPGIGKSWFVSTLAMMVAHGGGISIAGGTLAAGDYDWEKVLVFDEEMILYDIKERNARLSNILYLGEREDEIAGNIEYFLKSDQAPNVKFIDIANPEDRDRIINAVLLSGAKLVIFDNLSTLSSSLRDENDASSWNPLNDLIISLKGIGVATLLVHHSNRSRSGGNRGSSNIAATLEVSLKLEPVEGESEYEGAQFKVHVDKGRRLGAKALEGKIFRLPPEGGEWQCGFNETGPEAQIVIELRTLTYRNQKELAKALGISQGEVSKKLKNAISVGMITEAEKKACFAGKRYVPEGCQSLNGCNGIDFTDDVQFP